MSDGEVEDIKAAKEKLMTDSQSLFQKVYEQSQGAQGTDGAAGGFDPNQGFGGQDGAGAQGGYNGGNDDVVDADYKEV